VGGSPAGDGGTQGELFGVPGQPAGQAASPPGGHAGAPAGGMVVRVVIDVRQLHQQFDYLVPDELAGDVGVGTLVEVHLGPRRLRGWVVAVGVEPPDGVELRSLTRVRSVGPDPGVVDLTAWGAWRFAGSRSALLAGASAPVLVPRLPRPRRPRNHRLPDAVTLGSGPPLATSEVFTAPLSVVRVPPLVDPYPLVAAAAGRGPCVVVAPTHQRARGLLDRLVADGHGVAGLPAGWAAARAGGVGVVGTRGAVWASCAPLTSVVVVDEHDASLAQTQAPTWHARTVAIERARAAGVPCVLVSPVPSLEALGALEASGGRLFVSPQPAEAAGWPEVEVVDLRYEDPLGAPLITEALAGALRSGARVLCVLNRRGRARLLACNGCGEIVRCEACGRAMAQDTQGTLHCAACATERPAVCAVCNRTSLRAVRRGVSRLAEDLAAMVGEDVTELAADGSADGETTRVTVGTEAALHRLGGVDVVALVDFDQELLSPRFRAGEEALALVVAAGRLVGSRAPGSSGAPGRPRVLIQTSVPDHPVVVAARTADPAAFAAGEWERRRQLGWPPATAMALVSGEVAAEFIDAMAAHATAGGPIEVLGPVDERWLVRAPSHDLLCDVLAVVPRPPGRLRVEMDPLRA